MRLLAIASLSTLLACASAPQKPTVKAVEVSDQQAAFCSVLAKNTVIACVVGYVHSGGERENEESPAYKFGMVACSEGGQAAFEGCLDDAFAKKYGTNQANICADIARFITDSVVKGCAVAKTTYPSEKSIYKACVEVWAPKGAAEHTNFCEQQKERVEL